MFRLVPKVRESIWRFVRSAPVCNGVSRKTRTADECEKRWYSLQSHARAEIAEFKRPTSPTGGGSAPKALSPISSMVYSILGHFDTSITGLERSIDPAMQLLNTLDEANSSVAIHGNTPALLPPVPLAPAPFAPGPAPASHAEDGGGGRGRKRKAEPEVGGEPVLENKKEKEDEKEEGQRVVIEHCKS
ncbi:hypothetical protein SKAU_G00031870 [Synaphobranchus kaupii]|uniref:Myb-like domain-containing protein n=1 Tax=Synaphobranchus kaupii TaxID=118154 RepID=A0A9Q1JG82_SYNKA|nr:hypothetical protein SKAU_G00031870 [Synaphobranchus kaupii]